MGKRLDKIIDILIRYRKSIYFDYFLLFIAEIITLFSGALFTIYFGNFGKIFLVFLMFALIAASLTQDFFDLSIGKRLYKIKIDTNNQTKMLLLKSLIIRKVMESTYNPYLKMNFVDICNRIDALTLTKIVERKPKRKS
jgi:hypothetical protein